MYEWDEDKHLQNLIKHGLSFMLIHDLDWDASEIKADTRGDYGKDRFVATGPIEGRLFVVVFTQRAGKVRLISLRKANARERKSYAPRKSYIDEDGEAMELDEQWFREAKGIDHFPELKRIVMRGRPPLPEDQCKKRVTMYLDRDVIEALKKDGRGWQTRANATLRAALGLPK